MENTLLKYLFVAFLLVKGTFSCVPDDATIDTSYNLVGTTIYTDCCRKNSAVNAKWVYPNGTEILLGPKSSIHAQKPEEDPLQLYLQIPNLTLSMSGTYRCEYKDDKQTYTLKHYTVVAYEPFYFVNDETQYITLNGNSTILCEVKGGYGEQFIFWTKMKTKNEIPPMINDDKNSTVAKKYKTINSELIITNVVDEDKGTYICNVQDSKTSMSSNYAITVEVIEEPVIEDIILSPEAVVIAGESLYMECKANGTPYPEIIWRRIIDSAIASSFPHHQQNEDLYKKINSTGVITLNVLSFEKITPEDEGIYECIAKNRAGEARQDIKIKVLEAPRIIQFDNMTEVDGNIIQLTCIVTSRPESNVTIIFLGKNEDYWEITEENIFENNQNLTVKPDREGYYICNASNEVNYTQEKMYLSVLHQPYFTDNETTAWGWPGTSVNISCENDANPTAEVYWRRYSNNNKSAEDQYQKKMVTEIWNKLHEAYLIINISHDTELYGDYGCKAKNNFGSDEKIITLRQGFVPNQIQNVSDEIKPTEVLFRIEKPAVIGPHIIGYMAEYDEDANYKVTNIHKNRTWSIDREQEGFKLEGLKPDTRYQIKFAAKNAVGISEWGEIYTFTTLKPSVPSPPIWEAESEFVNVTENQILKWRAPEENGAPIDNYIVRYCLDYRVEDESCTEMITSNSILQMDTSILRKNSTYFLQLQAKNTIGISLASNITVTTPAYLRRSLPVLPTGAIIGISIMVVLLALLVLDVLLCACRRQGIIAHCYYNNKRTRNNEKLQIRDKKGLLKDNCEPRDDNTKKHKEFEYNKATGIITGKHSSV